MALGFPGRHMVCLLFLITMSVTPVFAKESLRIDKVSAIPKAIDLSKNEKAKITFDISESSFVTILLRDENMNLINQFELGLKSKGPQTFEWDGQNGKNEKIKTDVVIYTINARTVDDRRAAYDPTAETGGLELKDFRFSLDRESGKVEYVLPQAARVRIRAGLQSGMLLQTIKDWEPEEAGQHEFLWDGKDKSGEMTLLKHSDLNMNLNAFSLSDNTIIIKGIQVDYEKPGQAFHPINHGKHFHHPHSRMVCHEPRFSVYFLEANGQDKDGNSVVAGKTRVEIKINQKDEKELIQKRFEVMFYLDEEFLFEEEQAVSPSTFYLDFSRYAPGKHLLTVNLMSYDDHIGVETVRIQIQKPI